ncbi:MAG: fibronectin type III domain-containing protein, partial [Nitrosopumilus sp.]|nr:fibronectin type III domain-containing protein [Nitrosopumilus sp.]
MFSILFTLCIVSVQIAHAQPEFVFEFGSTGNGSDEFDNPTDVIVDKNGKNIYVVDNNNDRISVFDKNGNYDFQYGTFCNMALIQNCNDNADGADNDGDGQFNNPISIARDALGKFFVVDEGNQRVQIFHDDGKFQSKFGSSNSADSNYLGSAKGIAIQDGTRDIFVSNIESDSISVFDSAGNFKFEFDSFNGNDGFKNPTNMEIDNSNKMLYVSDSGNNRVIVFKLVTGTICPSGTEKSADGVCFVKKFGSAGTANGKFDEPAGVAFDSTNDLLYVADSDNDRIQVFKIIDGTACPNGTEEIVNGVCFEQKFGTLGTADGQFNTPVGIAIDETNDLLYVADSDNDRIQVFDLNSKPTTLIPDSPKNLKAFPISPTSAIIFWEEPTMAQSVPAITGYKIEYKSSSGNYVTVVENTASKTTSFIHQGLQSNETYVYRIYSINSKGISSASSSISVQPKHTTTPTAFTADAISPNQIRLSWIPPSETYGQPINGYEVKQELSSGAYNKVGTTDRGTTTFTVSGLITDKTYTYAVSAKIGSGTTSESNSASATPRSDSVNKISNPVTSTAVQVTKSSPPIKLTATVVSPTQINLSWSSPVDDGKSPITGYKIEVKKDNDLAFTTLVADTKSTEKSYSHTNVITNSKYTYRVSAINAIGISEPTNEFSVTPRSTNIKISPIGKLSIDEGKLLSFAVKLADSSVKDVVFSLENNPPVGAKIISNTGMFSWTPTLSDGGRTYSMDIVAKKDGQSDRVTITITVNEVSDEVKPTPAVIEPKGIAPF